MNGTHYSLTEALAALAGGKKKAAQFILAEILEKEPANTLAWLYLAATLPRDGAIQALRRVLILDPENSIAGRNLERLRTTNTELEFRDLYHEPKITPFLESNLPLFDDEPPTINLRELSKLAEFGDETGTLPIAFSLLSKSSTAAAYRPNVSVTLADIFSKQELELLEESVRRAVPPPPIPTPIYSNSKIETARPSASPVETTRPSAPARLSYSPSPERAPVVSRPPAPTTLAGPVHFVSGTLRATQNLPDFTPPELSRLPRLQERPRYMLGTTPRPVFGFTEFGIIILAVVSIVFVVTLLMLLQV